MSELHRAAAKRRELARDEAVAAIARELGGLSLMQWITVAKALDEFADEAVHLRALSGSPYEWP